jgi:hypothetical protein
MANSKSWKKIFDDYEILKHDFDKSPFPLSATQIKRACQKFKETGEKEVRILCKQDSREDRPDIFQKYNLFLLPVKNGYYNIIKGEGYIDIPEIKKEVVVYSSKLDFQLDTTKIEPVKEYIRYIENFINRCVWTFAKTMPQTPHHYVVRDNLSYDDKKMFDALGEYIKRNGYSASFASKRYDYLNTGGFKYWIIGNILNKAKISQK